MCVCGDVLGFPERVRSDNCAVIRHGVLLRVKNEASRSKVMEYALHNCGHYSAGGQGVQIITGVWIIT